MPARVPRIYQPCSLTVGQHYGLTAAASHHLINVLRLSIGDRLVVFNNTGNEYAAHLVDVNKRTAMVEIKTCDLVDCESPLQITLAHGLARGEKMDLIIQKAVELGVSHFVPLLTQYTNVKLSGDRLTKRHEHWQQVIISASEQCGRNRLMSIVQPMPFLAFITKIKAHDITDNTVNLLLDPAGQIRLSDLNSPTTKQVNLLVGPEGGFSTDEINHAKQASFQGIQLGPRILRTETAALAVVSILQTQWGDFS